MSTRHITVRICAGCHRKAPAPLAKKLTLGPSEKLPTPTALKETRTCHPFFGSLYRAAQKSLAVLDADQALLACFVWDHLGGRRSRSSLRSSPVTTLLKLYTNGAGAER